MKEGLPGGTLQRVNRRSPGAIALAGIGVINSDYYRLCHSLLNGDALVAVIASVLAGATTIALVWSRRYDAARFGAAVAVAAIIAGWALARWPTTLPGLTVKNGAAGHDALVWIVVSVLVGGAIVFPSLGLLFRLELTGRFRADASTSSVLGGTRRPFDPPRLTRVAVACLIAGLGLLTIADAAWAHAIGVVSLLGFMVAAFLRSFHEHSRTRRRTQSSDRSCRSSRREPRLDSSNCR